jgi:hypothetical protein
VKALAWNLGLALLLAVIAAGVVIFGAVSVIFVMLAAAWEFGEKVAASLIEMVASGWEKNRR